MHTDRVSASLLAVCALLGAGAAAAVAEGAGGDSPVIAIIDSGIDLQAARFAGRMLPNTGEVPANLLDRNDDVADTLGHGTAVASIVLDHAPERALLRIYRVSGTRQVANLDDVSLAIVAAADAGADVINLSLVAENAPRDLVTAVAYAQRRGAIVVAAAGNAGANTSDLPGGLPGVIRVGAMDGAGTVPAFSNRNPDVVAPGTDVETLRAGQIPCVQLEALGATSCDNASDRMRVTGTSFAAASVSGLLAYAKDAHPALTSEEAEQLLRSTAHDIEAMGVDPASGAGAVDADAFLAALEPPLPRALPSPGAFLPRGAFARDLLAARHIDTSSVRIAGNAVYDALRTPYLRPLAAARSLGVVRGKWFAPERNISRAEALVLADRLLKLPAAGTELLVPPSIILPEQRSLVARCLAAGIGQRWPNDALNAALTVEEAAQILEAVRRADAGPSVGAEPTRR